VTWRRLRSLVERALDVPEDERASWLAGECGDDADLRDEAQALLDAALADESFLEPAPRAPAMDEGDRVGPYRLVRMLASGGMGTVFLAERASPRRRVALKIMRAGLADAEAKRRFEYEVEVLAGLQHANIAQMYETGVHAVHGLELPWFAMEYVEGARDLVACARGKGLGLRDRVALFVQVCDAVEHGHRSGVLHRDLKPGNLLVDESGRCKVIDFGVARATDADLDMTTMRTSTGEIVGTLAYMSPEQVEGDRAAVDSRSDVYALGVVLFELLTGELPYPARGNAFEVMRTIRDVPPRRPSGVLPALRGDLETIVLKCLAKEAERRYATAGELGKDLRRFLDGEPIAAHPPSVPYQLRVFARRHKALVGAAVAILVVAVAAAAVSIGYAVRAHDSEKTALSERDRAKELFEGLLQRNAEMYEYVPRVSNLAGGAPTALEMTKSVMADLEYLQSLASDDPAVRKLIANSYIRLGEVHVRHEGDRKAGLDAFRRAYEAARALREERPDDADVSSLLAWSLVKLGRWSSDTRSLLEAVRILEDLPRDDRDVTWRLASAYEGLARVTPDRDREKQRELFDRQRVLMEELARRWPDHPNARSGAARARVSLAGLEAASRNYEAASGHFRAALDAYRALAAERPGAVGPRFDLAWCELQLGRCLHAAREHAEAEEHLRAARDLYLALLEQDPRDAKARSNLAMAQLAYAANAHDFGDLEAARDGYLAAWEIWDELERKGSPPAWPFEAAQIRQWFDNVRRQLGEE